MAFVLEHLDHMVLTVANIDATIDFYTEVLGMDVVKTGGRTALAFGIQRLNLHQRGHEFEPKAAHPTPGSADLCFLTTTSLDTVVEYLKEQKVHVESGPVEREGAIGKLRSIYLRDPDRNLIEIAVTV
jgi:catechol 2,3-dioxygenase-like lactoylglutathione lyase family enzyme